MTELFNQLLEWVANNNFWAGVAVFFVAFSESVAILGLLVPGVVLMFGFGALIATGTLEFWPVYAWAVAGAVTGDGLSFWIGRHFQDQLRGFWPFSRHPRTLERGIDFFQRYGGKSVAIGRFFGPVRAVIPLVAGMLGMPVWRFIIANLLSALVWAPAYLLPGVVLGASLELASEVAFRLVLLLLLLLITVWLVFQGVRGFYRLTHSHTTQIVQTLCSWGGRHRGFQEIARALGNPKHPEIKGLTQLASLLIFSTALFALLAGLLPSQPTQTLDTMLHNSLQSLRAPWSDELMVHFTRLGDLSIILIFAGTVGLSLLLRRDWRTLGYWLAATLFGLLVPVLLKYGLRIPRPESGVEHLGPWSFPSAHVLRSLTVYGFFAVMIARSILRDWRWLSYGFVAVAVAAIGLSRLYLGVHWLTDVVGSLLLGLAWISALGIAYHRHTQPATHPMRLTLGVTGILLLTLTCAAWLHQEETVRRFQPGPASVSLQETAWISGEADLPSYRHDVRGRFNHPLDIQFVGDLEMLSSQLQLLGWQPADQLSWSNLLRLLSPSLSLQELPVLPQVHDGRHETLLLAKPLADGGRLVLRVWSSAYRMADSLQPLWLGNVASQRKVVNLNILSYPVTVEDFDTPLSILRGDLVEAGLSPMPSTDNPLMIRQ
ncbi:MAG: VTT domain-containing protein [Gammaproteobacteria bacterium]|nr:VTT domain-containing protein [Gammaproteobacteria bacterium]